MGNEARQLKLSITGNRIGWLELSATGDGARQSRLDKTSDSRVGGGVVSDGRIGNGKISNSRANDGIKSKIDTPKENLLLGLTQLPTLASSLTISS